MPKSLRVLSILLLAGCSASAQDAQKPAPAEFKIPPEASKLANPVKPTPASLAQEMCIRDRLIEEVGIHSGPGPDDEEARAGVAFEIEILHAAERNATGHGMKSGTRRYSNIHGQTEVVRQRVGRAHGQNREGSASVRQHLDHVVDGAVAAAGKHRVTTRQNGLPRLLLRVSTRIGEDEVGLDVCPAEQRQHGFQLRLAPHAPAAGVRVIE